MTDHVDFGTVSEAKLQNVSFTEPPNRSQPTFRVAIDLVTAEGEPVRDIKTEAFYQAALRFPPLTEERSE